jgi:hypothetical protein
VRVSLFVSTYVFVSLCLIIFEPLFDYHSSYLCEIVLEVSIILTLQQKVSLYTK